MSGVPLAKFIPHLSATIRDGKEEAIASLFSPKFVIYEDPSLPYGGIFFGYEGFRKVQTAVYSAWPERKVSILQMLTDEKQGAIAILAKMSGQFPGRETRAEAYVSEFWTVRDGQAVEARVSYWDGWRIANLLRDPSNLEF